MPAHRLRGLRGISQAPACRGGSRGACRHSFWAARARRRPAYPFFLRCLARYDPPRSRAHRDFHTAKHAMTSARENILGKVRSALGKTATDAASLAEAQAYIDAHAQGP